MSFKNKFNLNELGAKVNAMDSNELTLRMWFAVFVFGIIVYSIYSFYLLITISDNILFTNYLSMAIVISIFTCKPTITQTYDYMVKFIMPIFIIYIIYYLSFKYPGFLLKDIAETKLNKLS